MKPLKRLKSQEERYNARNNTYCKIFYKRRYVKRVFSGAENNGFPEVVQSENGCIEYNYFVSAFGKENVVVLIEKWESEKLQKAHLDTPHMQNMKTFKDSFVEKTTVEIFE